MKHVVNFHRKIKGFHCGMDVLCGQESLFRYIIQPFRFSIRYRSDAVIYVDRFQMEVGCGRKSFYYSGVTVSYVKDSPDAEPA